MSIKYEVVQNIALVIGFLFLVMVALMPMAMAETLNPDIYDQWNSLDEFENTRDLRNFLIEKNWISDEVDIVDLDYILVLVQQCSKEFFPAIPTALVLSIISIESGFRKDITGFSNDSGLMQIIPRFHKERIEKYLYDENVDIYDPRVNIMVGMDYLDELLNWARGDLERTIMAYNMGHQEADRFANVGRITVYAQEVTERMNEIQKFLDGR